MTYAAHNATQIWLIIGGLTLLVLVTRNAFNLFGEKFKLTGKLSQALDYAPIAALVAIVVPEFVRTYQQLGGNLTAHVADGRFIAGIVLVIVGVISRNSMVALVAGGLTFGFVMFCA